jgi:tetratricopeptide (TPR) repeat protein
MNEDQGLNTATLERAAKLRQSRQHGQAETLCRQVLQASPNCAAAWHLLGLISSDTGNFSAAVAMLDKATTLDAAQPAYYKALADAYAATGDNDEAIHSYRQALGLKPDYFEVHSNLGGALLDAGRWDEAVHHYRQAVQLRPDIAELHDNLGNALRIAGYCETAISCHEQALRLKPALVTARSNMGSALSKLGRQREAIEAFESALQLAPDMPEVHVNLAALLASQGRLDEALTHYRTLSRLHPEYLGAVAGEADVLMEMGELDSARRRLEPYAAMRGRHAGITLAFSALARETAQQRDSIDDLDRLLEQGISSAEELRRVHFRLAGLHDQTGSYDRAFEHYRRGNQLKPHHFDRAEHRRHIEQIMSTFNERSMPGLPRAGNDSELPVFFVGMPRSGKTLIEQILAAHPQVTGAGELPDIRDINSVLERQTGAPFPLSLGQITVEQLDELANGYLSRRTAEAFPRTLRVIDTMPFNIEQLGLIAMLFPHAHIVHCRRDPRDMLLECYFKDFGAGHSYANDLADLAFRYHQYDRLCQHWKNTLATAQLEVHYEELVLDPETVSQRLTEFLGLQWEPGCLDFHRSKATRLIGGRRWREPINDRAVGRWKNYQRHLQPLLQALQQ